MKTITSLEDAINAAIGIVNSTDIFKSADWMDGDDYGSAWNAIYDLCDGNTERMLVGGRILLSAKDTGEVIIDLKIGA